MSFSISANGLVAINDMHSHLGVDSVPELRGMVSRALPVFLVNLRFAQALTTPIPEKRRYYPTFDPWTASILMTQRLPLLVRAEWPLRLSYLAVQTTSAVKHLLSRFAGPPMAGRVQWFLSPPQLFISMEPKGKRTALDGDI